MTLNISFSSNSRRGISSVVGALIFTVLMIAGFSAMSLALDSQTDIVNTQRVVSDTELKKQQEQFGVAVFTDANNILNVSVDNKGQNPVEISRVWITNKTLATQPATPFYVNSDDAFIPTGFTSNVLSHQPLYMIPDTYDVKVISTLGTVKITEFTVGSTSSSDGLRAELITDPPDVIIGQNVTVAMIVTNISEEEIADVTPGPLTLDPITAKVASSSPTPASVTLGRGESVMFSWDYTVTGNSGDVLTFSAFATSNNGNSNTVSDESILRLPTDGGTIINPDIVTDDLLARPQLFFVIPSSQGESGNAEALWGINVVNPINAPMEVSKLIITAFAPGANANNVIFDRTGGDCTFNPVSPTVGPDTDWSCPSENALMWQDNVNPIIVPANSTRAFLTKVEPGKPTGNTGLESVLVQGSVFTTLGSFGKSGYQSTMSSDTTSIANVYLSSLADSRSSSNIQSSRIGMLPNSVQTFNIIFADMDLSSTTTINSGAKLIINVPKDWKDVIVTGDSGFDDTPTVTPFGDTSHQIVGITSESLGSATNLTDTITFTARAPNLTSDKLYVMYVLAQGTTSNGFSIGPLAEIVLQVDTP